MSIASENGGLGAFPNTDHIHPYCGLTKREYFAGLAMQGLCTVIRQGHGPVTYRAVATDAVCAADALLEALEANNE